jgi:hypothetical protein
MKAKMRTTTMALSWRAVSGLLTTPTLRLNPQAGNCVDDSGAVGPGCWNGSGVASTGDQPHRVGGCRSRKSGTTARPARWHDRKRERAAVSIHLSSGGTSLRRVVISCDVAGCPVQLEPPAAERWRSDADARAWARDHAVGWTCDLVRQTDYCPQHAEFSTAPAIGEVPPRPTASVRDSAGNPLNRDEYAERLRARLTAGGPSAGHALLTAAQGAVVARLLDELAGVYRGESLGTLAHELSVLLDSQLGEPD